ncbi:MAG: cell surface protein, partial [Methanosarcina sp.]|nr:cell surface protein [Methanosarcina sp.]
MSTSESYKKSISIYGNRIVWEDYRSDHPDIYMYDISTSTETRITTSESVDDPVAGTYNPVIYGDRIVWEDYRNGNNDIYMATLTWAEEPPLDDSNETQVTTSGSAGGPSIYGNRIVYSSTRNGNTDVYMYDRSTKKETQITSSPDHQTHPAIYENKIVWQDDGGEDDGWVNHGIFMYDISTKKKMRISPTELAYDPAIYGNRIVYSSTRSGNTDVYMYDLSTSKETQITSSPD